MEKFFDKLSEIDLCLEKYNLTENRIGLIGGDMSVKLYQLHCNELSKDDKVFKKVIEEIEYLLKSVIVEKESPFFASGLSGFCLFIEYIDQKEWLEIDSNSVIGDLDEYLYLELKRNIQVENYDLLYGAIGIGYYFIYRSRKSDVVKKYIEECVEHLDKVSITEADGSTKWTNYDITNKRIIANEYNLGLAHGIPSILSFLIKVHKEGILTEKTEQMIKSTLKYLMKQTLPKQENRFVFPFIVNNLNQPVRDSTRIAWCYGDLGVCCVLWQAAQMLNDKVLEQEVIDIMLHAVTIRGRNETQIIDAGLCHGAAGAAHIFQRFYDWTNVPEFKEAADYWYGMILEMATFEDGYAGFKTHHTEEYGGSRPSANFLDGISGIGLALLYKISGIDPSWEELLFIR